jgi:hypothetical protein
MRETTNEKESKRGGNRVVMVGEVKECRRNSNVRNSITWHRSLNRLGVEQTRAFTRYTETQPDEYRNNILAHTALGKMFGEELWEMDDVQAEGFDDL